MPGQPLVGEGIVRVNEFQDAAILAQNGTEKHLRLPPHRLAQILVEVRKLFRVRHDQVQIAELQPLTGEVFNQRIGPRIAQHPLDL